VSDSAASAYEQLSAKGARFDVVITDIGMPVEDGYSLVRKLRALRSGNRVLAVALTGLTSTHDAAAALAAGFDLHVREACGPGKDRPDDPPPDTSARCGRGGAQSGNNSQRAKKSGLTVLSARRGGGKKCVQRVCQRC
jgi:hypothetical protein